MIVMLSETKHFFRFFAEFTLSEVEGLRMTRREFRMTNGNDLRLMTDD